MEQINAIMNSPYWQNTAIFVTWDDPDGVYDHIAPPDVRRVWPGAARADADHFAVRQVGGYVSHTVYETSSVLKFIEERYNLALPDRPRRQGQ